MPDDDQADRGSLRWIVCRQGDDGNRFEVERLRSRAEAQKVAATLEARGHRQTYWIEDPVGWSDLVCEILTVGVSPTPSRAQLVSALADARRQLVERGHGDNVGASLDDARVRGGLFENAATLAALETFPDRRNAIAAAYVGRHPERHDLLARLMSHL